MSVAAQRGLADRFNLRCLGQPIGRRTCRSGYKYVHKYEYVLLRQTRDFFVLIRDHRGAADRRMTI